ncbi:MAG: YidC/Oxa1 family membrane protein insertase [Clostridia bacterium]|nr:YidC/Oxa1 family membrane protein insertase [Clostridia bacterium]
MGIWEIICMPFGYLIKFCYNLTGSYAIALFLFAFVVKIILFPFGIKQQKNTIKQAKMRPKEQAIRNKYAGRTDQATQQKMQQEIMDLYQKEGYNPAGGCLPLMIQMPIIFALYSVVRNPLTYISGIVPDTLAKIKEIAAGIINNGAQVTENQLKTLDEINLISPITSNPEAFENLIDVTMLPDMNLFGFSLADKPSWETLFVTGIFLIPLFVLVTGYLQQFIIQKLSYSPSPEAAKQMKTMNMVMPLMSVWFSFMLPAALGLYWAFQNILAIVQQYILYKMYPIPVITEEQIKEAEREMRASKRNNARVAPDKRRSLIYDDDDNTSNSANPGVVKPSNKSEKETDKGIISQAPLKEDMNTDK